MAKIRTAVLQTPVSADKQKNIDRVAEVLDRMQLRDVDLVTLPEMFNCPYETGNFPLYAEETGGPTWQAMSDLAAAHHIYLSAGSIPEVDVRGRVYNTAYVFDREGKQIAKHRKMHLFDIAVEKGQHFKESDTLTAGNEITVFDTEFCKMGLCICYDMRFPELSRLMVDRGAKVLLCPAAFNNTTGPLHWEMMFRSRAVDNQVFTIGTAPALDPDASYLSYGHSIVVDPWGTVLVEMDTGAHFELINLDLDRIDEVRAQLPLSSHRRTDLYRTIGLG